MSKRSSKGSRVTLGSTAIASINAWSAGEIANTLLDSTTFEDDFDTFEVGWTNGGVIDISGYYDPDDATGQELLRTYQLAGTPITNLRLYFGDANDEDFLTLVQDTTAYVENISPISTDRRANGMMPISIKLRVSAGVLVKARAIYTADTLAFVEGGGSADTITDSANGLVGAGFTAGMGIIVEGSSNNDGRSYTIDTGGAAAGALTLVSGDDLVDESAGTDFTLIGYTKLTY